jgi:hypothetical protein
MPSLRFKRDFNFERLTWSRPDSHIIPFCSICFRHMPEEKVPMMMWNDEGACVQLCDECIERWIESVP